jgi:hypothetical protein
MISKVVEEKPMKGVCTINALSLALNGCLGRGRSLHAVRVDITSTMRSRFTHAFCADIFVLPLESGDGVQTRQATGLVD